MSSDDCIAQLRTPTRSYTRNPVPFAALLVVAALGACGDTAQDSGPGAVSESEARALDEAAEMLDERRLPPEALPDLPATEQPSPEVTGDTAD